MSDDDKPADHGKNKGRPEPPKEHRWKPGQSGNPSGRPKGSISFDALLRRELAKNDKELATAMVKVMIREALKGRFPYTKEILDRIDGKPADRTVITGAGGGPIEVVDHRKVLIKELMGLVDQAKTSGNAEIPALLADMTVGENEK